MEIIGQEMHLMNQTFLQALEKKDKQAVILLARRQIEAGATALDVNLGQNRKLGCLTPWLVETIQQAVEAPLFLSNYVLSQQRALEIHKGTATINAVTANRTELVSAMKTASFFGARLVILLVSSACTPVDAEGRLNLAMDVLDVAKETGFPLEHLYLDPVMSCRPDPVSWSLSGGLPDIDLILDSIRLVGELSGHRLRTIVALNNTCQFLDGGARSASHCRLLHLLIEAGLDAVIMNCRDQNCMAVAKKTRLSLAA
ncbi:MAG: dihydropteroate synthase [Proteobacteria bacterium]|nr:hypothetical protein [Desulfocapsa sp.]MBU3945459.1 dihydropteroate synthase [Pseudomonadota bacterium]MCG2743587.1 dihydropteroate synthase [Desulfobacteraceae bacterium]MBU3983078.1 dihydropteroate synthase [Pseudomonadota bacterium]MBU4029170.1 dihydropteroate synthase [Pseudomonadota bacterium]